MQLNVFVVVVVVVVVVVFLFLFPSTFLFLLLLSSFYHESKHAERLCPPPLLKESQSLAIKSSTNVESPVVEPVDNLDDQGFGG